MSFAKFVRIYLVPGAVFQSILVGGGYGTGREVVEYFTRFGPTGGLLAAGLACAIFALVLVLTFEVSRRFSAYDYRAFFKILLGRFWFLYEIAGALLMLLVFAVLIAAAGSVMNVQFGVSPWVGMALVFLLVGTLEFFGREAVMRVLAFWSIVLYVVFGAFLFLSFQVIPDQIAHAFQSGGIAEGWAESGFKYAMYNATGAPIILFVAREFENSRQTMGAGVVAAIIGIAPALMFHLAFSGAEPKILSEEIPVFWMMNYYGMGVLAVAFTIMLFGTLIETGAGVLQGVNERIDSFLSEKGKPGLSKMGHSGVAMGFMAIAMMVASVGIVNLIAKGYGTLAWSFCFLYFIPLLTVGVWRLVQARDV
ncbi:MAG: hypothetical protein O7G86_07175 [Gammaproteobacteria bacterium]|nr:hypothetical protein [Gammaproteobacteria bacterium]